MIKKILKIISAICVLPLDLSLASLWYSFITIHKPLFTFEPFAIFFWTFHWILAVIMFFILPAILISLLVESTINN
jgi:hypothetical protein